MKDPKELELHMLNVEGVEVLYGVSLPTYVISGKGPEDVGTITLPFCKGTKESKPEDVQPGVFSESLIQAALTCLINVNSGTLKNIYTTEAIQYLRAALGCLDARKTKREEDGTIYTKKS